MENPEIPKRCGPTSWSIIRKAQVIGAMTAMLVTIIMLLLLLVAGPVALFFAKLVQSPTISFLNTVCPKFIDSLRAQPDHRLFWFTVWLCLVTAINSCLLFLAGTIIGWLIQKTKTKSY